MEVHFSFEACFVSRAVVARTENKVSASASVNVKKPFHAKASCSVDWNYQCGISLVRLISEQVSRFVYNAAVAKTSHT